MTASLSQALVQQQLFTALQERDVAGVEAVAPQVNWIQMYVDSLGEPRTGVVLWAWSPADPERYDPEVMRWWQNFAAPALNVMVEHGFRVLDDPALASLFSAWPETISMVARVATDFDVRGDRMETAAHKAIPLIPYHAQLKAALDEGVDVNAQTDTGATVLHQVWQELPLDRTHAKEWAKSTQELLARGANPLLKNEDGVSAQKLIEEGLAEPMMSRHREALLAQLEASVKAFSASLPKPSVRRR